MRYNPITDPAMLGTREHHPYELLLEQVFQRPFHSLVIEAEQSGTCTREDLLQMGHRLYLDHVRLARGELSSLHIPAERRGGRIVPRLPRAGEYRATVTN